MSTLDEKLNITDALTLQRIDREAVHRTRAGAGDAVIDYADAPEFTEDWTDLSEWVANAQVSGNRLYAAGAGKIALKSFPIQAGTNGHLATTIRYVTGTGTQATYFGFDVGTADHPVSTDQGVFIGCNSGGAKAGWAGANFPAPILDQSNTGPALYDGDYLATIDFDPKFITFALTRIGAPSDDIFTFRVSRTALAAAGKTPTNIILYCDDTRALNGHSFGPVVAVKSLQPARTKTLAGQRVEGAAHRTITTQSPTGDNWRLSIPASYDPRRPAPVVLYHHQSITGNQNVPWSESRARPVTNALLNAGYIVAAANDGGDRWGNQASLDNYHDLYKYVRANFSTGPLFLLGVSMGFMPVLNALVRRDLPTPAAVASIGGVADLDTLFVNNSSQYAAGIRFAYGIAADGSNYEAKTAGYNPMDRAGDEFRGVPMRFYTSAGDGAVPRATNADAMSAKVAPYSPEEAVVAGGGGHLDSSQFNASDLVSFFNRYL